MSTGKYGFEGESVRRFRGPPRASWTSAIPLPRGPDAKHTLFLPQAIAHRGFKAAWPENSLAGFEAAAQVGAHALETDLRLSADGVIVLSHDPSLKRCFGVDRLVGDCDWEFLSGLKTVREPGEGMARLSDLLEWLVGSPEWDGIWLMLDIKISDDADKLMLALKRTLERIPSRVPWDQRIVLGCWNATYIQSAISLLPSFALCHISMSVSYSRHFWPLIPNLAFSMSQVSLMGPWGTRFLGDVKTKRKKDGEGSLTFAWTVNQERWMEWFVRKNISSASEPVAMIDGVITDDPQLFLSVCSRIRAEMDGTPLPALPNGKAQGKASSTPKPQGRIASFFREGMSSIYRLLLGSFFRAAFFFVMRYRGCFDYLSDADFLAQFSAVSDEEDDDNDDDDDDGGI